MSDDFEIHEFKTLENKARLRTFFNFWGFRIFTVVVAAAVITNSCLSVGLYFLLNIPIFILLIPVWWFRDFTKKCTHYIKKISVNSKTETLYILIDKNGIEEEIELKKGTYSVIKRSGKNLNYFAHIEILKVKPYRIVFKQYLIGDWSGNEGYEILAQYAHSSVEQKYKPYGSD